MEKKSLIAILLVAALIISVISILAIFPPTVHRPTVYREPKIETVVIKTSEYPTAQNVVFQIDLGAAELNMTQANDPTMIAHVEARYDIPELKPKIIAMLDGDILRITIKTERPERVIWQWPENITNHYTIVLGTYNRTTSFNMDLGASKISMKPKKMPLEELNIDSGASKILLDFSETSNPINANIDLDTGASTLDVISLGNSNFKTFKVDAGAATANVDFSGNHSAGSAEAIIDVGAATLNVIIPKEMGCRLRIEGMGTTNVAGEWISIEETFGKREYGTPNHEISKFKLDLRIDAGVSTINIKRQ
jgi:hypothetical protein